MQCPNLKCDYSGVLRRKFNGIYLPAIIFIGGVILLVINGFQNTLGLCLGGVGFAWGWIVIYQDDKNPKFECPNCKAIIS